VINTLLFYILFIMEFDPPTDSKTLADTNTLTESDTDTPSYAESKGNHSISFSNMLHPLLVERGNQLIQKAADTGIIVVVTDDYRSAEEQNQLFKKGRSVGGKIVTYARGGESYHNYGLAIDFALKTPSGEIIWDMKYDGNNNGTADWTEVVYFAKSLGFEWGGDWDQFKDYPHLQMDFGLTLRDLQKGAKPANSSLTATPIP
jgi:peptidoglycan LD-endopeptidase CwlK